MGAVPVALEMVLTMTARSCGSTSGGRGRVTVLLAEAGAVAVMAGGSEVAVLLAGAAQY